MTPYRALLAAKFRGLVQYRVAAVAGICTQFFWGIIRLMIFTAFYRSSVAVQPLVFSDTVTYLWLTQAFLMLLPWRPDPDISEMVRTGNIAYELVKPVGLYPMWYMRSIAIRVAPTALRCPLVFGLAMLLFGMRAPPTWQCATLFACGLVCAILLGAALTALLTISVLWTLSSRGTITIVVAAVNMLVRDDRSFASIPRLGARPARVAAVLAGSWTRPFDSTWGSFLDARPCLRLRTNSGGRWSSFCSDSP
jgi:ABC-2 type transport system permease protein